MIGKVIKYVRKNKGLSQEDLSSLLKLNRTTLSNYETEIRQPTFETIEKILNKCGYKIFFCKRKRKISSKRFRKERCLMCEDYTKNQLTDEEKKFMEIKEYVENNLSCPNDNGDLIEIGDALFICSECNTYWGFNDGKLYNAQKNSND